MGSDTEAEKSIQKEKKKVISLAPIAKPLAGKKLQKRTFKLIQKGTNSNLTSTLCYSYHSPFLLASSFCSFLALSDVYCYVLSTAAGKKCLKRGVKEVVKSIRRGQKGLVFIFKCNLLRVECVM